MENNKKYNAIIIGATGAVGRELIDILLESNKYSNITIFVRRIIDRWVNLPEDKKNILKIIKCDNLDFLSLSKEEIIKKYSELNTQYDVLFNTLGSRVGRGDEEFKKVDYTYVVNSAILCEKLNIPHFSHCSAANADKSSWFLYSRVKGEAEEEESKKNINYISIFRPGIILDRDNDSRLGESIIAYVPFLPKISSKNIAKSMFLDDIEYQTKGKNEEKIVKKISNSDMLELIKNK